MFYSDNMVYFSSLSFVVSQGAKGAIANMFNRQMEKKKSDQSTKSENKVLWISQANCRNDTVLKVDMDHDIYACFKTWFFRLIDILDYRRQTAPSIIQNS